MTLALTSCPACQQMLEVSPSMLAAFLREAIRDQDWQTAAWLRRQLRGAG